MIDEDKEQNTLEKPRHIAKKKFCTCKIEVIKINSKFDIADGD